MAMAEKADGKGLVKALVLLAALQLVVLATLTADPTAVPLAGTDLSSLTTEDRFGASIPLGALESPALVMVFHSDCAHCRVIAPEWAEWFDEHPDGIDVIAVSREPLDDARAYADEHGWDVDVRSVRAERLGSLAHEVTRRTPWIFALDENARILSSGHGGELADLADLIARATARVAQGGSGG